LEGRLLQAVWFRWQDESRLLLVIHHFAVDGVSWRILAADLATACRAAMNGDAPRLAPEGTPFRSWAQHLAAQAQSPVRLKELPVWERMAESGSPLVPDRTLAPILDTQAAARSLSVMLPEPLTAALLTSVPAAFHASINDVLLVALAVAVA